MAAVALNGILAKTLYGLWGRRKAANCPGGLFTFRILATFLSQRGQVRIFLDVTTWPNSGKLSGDNTLAGADSVYDVVRDDAGAVEQRGYQPRIFEEILRVMDVWAYNGWHDHVSFSGCQAGDRRKKLAQRLADATHSEAHFEKIT